MSNHFGASLKDLGKKWFAFSKFDKNAIELLRKLDEVIVMSDYKKCTLKDIVGALGALFIVKLLFG